METFEFKFAVGTIPTLEEYKGSSFNITNSNAKGYIPFRELWDGNQTDKFLTLLSMYFYSKSYSLETMTKDSLTTLLPVDYSDFLDNVADAMWVQFGDIGLNLAEWVDYLDTSCVCKVNTPFLSMNEAKGLNDFYAKLGE